MQAGDGSTLKQIPAGIWILGLVSMLMDISSEMIHSLLPMFMVTTLGASALVGGRCCCGSTISARCSGWRSFTAYGFFSLVSGIAMLFASAVAGLLWDRLGAAATFQAGAGFCVIALIGLAWRAVVRPPRG